MYEWSVGQNAIDLPGKTFTGLLLMRWRQNCPYLTKHVFRLETFKCGECNSVLNAYKYMYTYVCLYCTELEFTSHEKTHKETMYYKKT